ncbi:FAD-dependent oxidoreductase [Cerasicoccus frondis]|uniref:FAD-dependent oxidoreductase n=1 Tax=Cerasicoccus frondis TaxID=490090 RepID=UPI00285268E3|nr:FAD-dependent oxidoreductase [Cerasicoccus frondis]
MNTIQETLPPTPVAYECDLCIIGGSCTGVFAAVRAAQLGLSVAIVEQNSLFGGMATAAQVNDWHSLHDTSGKKQIIGGLTSDTLNRLRERNAVCDRVRKDRGEHFIFNSAELVLELDQLILEQRNIRPFLRASCVSAIRSGEDLDVAIIEDKTGRRAIRARFFIDASGDGDLLRRAGFSAWRNQHLQPLTYQMMVAGLNRIMEKSKAHIWPQIADLVDQYQYPTDNATPWINEYGGSGDLRNIYGPRLNNIDASDADQLTAAFLESRRCHRALHDMIRERFGSVISPVSSAVSMGVRETWHANCLHRITANELLSGAQPEDSVACGTYPIDVHSAEGTLLRFLDGREILIGKDGKHLERYWKKASTPPSCYHVSYRSLLPQGATNLLVCGRLLDADREAFGGIRVMVNMNQTGEAAGTAAWLALTSGRTAPAIDVAQLRRKLKENGSLLP